MEFHSFIGHCFAWSITFPLRCITPLLSLFLSWRLFSFWQHRTVYSFFFVNHSLFWNILLVWAIIEIIFYFRYLYEVQRANYLVRGPNVPLERKMEIWKKIRDLNLSEPNGEQPWSFLDAWFSPESLDTISRCTLKKWLAWAVFDTSLEEFDRSNPKGTQIHQMMEKMIDDIEKDRKTKFPNVVKINIDRSDENDCDNRTLNDVDKKESSQLIRLNLDPCTSQHRAFIYYAVTTSMDSLCDLWLYYYYGFRRFSEGPLSYWHLKRECNTNGNNNDKSQELLPIVFVHGVGIGLSQYLPFLRQLTKSERSKRDILLVELPHVSMKLNVEIIPSVSTIVDSIEKAMKSHGMNQATFVGHSLGSFTVAAINNLNPKLVDGIVLIDPVCFQLWEADLVKNFCYRQPITPMQKIQYYHISQELFISYFFHREFWWHENVLFPQDLPEKSRVFTSEFDDIYNHIRVEKYLNCFGKHVKELKGVGHGGFILTKRCQKEILDTIGEISAKKIPSRKN